MVGDRGTKKLECSFYSETKMGGVDEFLRAFGSNLPPIENGDRL